jgi:hypothetical protein
MSEILHLNLHRNFFADIVEGKKASQNAASRRLPQKMRRQEI